jgi:hypothetical protein
MWGKGLNSMRFLRVILALVLGVSVSGWGQNNNNSFKVKSTPEKAPKSAPMGKTAASNNTAAANNAKNLQSIERANTRVPAASHTGNKAAGKNATGGLKQVKDKNPPINVNNGGSRGTGLMSKSSNPLQGRLKQKGKKN